MEKYLEETAVLALVQALCDFADVPGGRLESMLGRIQKKVTRRFCMLPRINGHDKNKLAKLIMDFEEKAGWDGRSKHILVYINFLLAVLDEIPVFPVQDLQAFQRHFERANKDPMACYDEGAKAADLFLGMVRESGFCCADYEPVQKIELKTSELPRWKPTAIIGKRDLDEFLEVEAGMNNPFEMEK